MTTNKHHQNWAHRLGQRAAPLWRRLVQRDRQVVMWLTRRGLPVGISLALTWTFKLLVLGALFYAAFLIALLLAFALGAAWILENSDSEAEPTKWAIGEQSPHKKSPSYHPMNYNDAPDPRFKNY